MGYIMPQTMNLQTCFQKHYSLPFFQREYRWEAKHFLEMLNDIQGAFVDCYESSHGRTAVADYAPYFLGSIITSAEAAGKKPLIDGQQRLTSAFVILAYIGRVLKDNNTQNVPDLLACISSVNFGKRDYSLEFSETRRKLFDAYLDLAVTRKTALQHAEEIDDLDSGDKRILEALRLMGAELNEVVVEKIEFFVDYLISRVTLIDISVSSEAEAHRVFVTMNDRGLRLGPIDLLKGRVLSKISDDVLISECHKTWVQIIAELKAIDAEEESLFFRNLFRAQWATTIRGKAKGDAPGDFDLIGDAYHRWFEDNTARLGISNADDYVRFVNVTLRWYANVYLFIKQSELSINSGFEHIYYNASRKFTLQPMVLMAVTDPKDSETEWKNKVKTASRLIDVILTMRSIDGKDNNYDNLRDISFALCKELRGKANGEFDELVKAEWARHTPSLANLKNVTYTYTDRTEVLHILSRIACFLEQAFELTTAVGYPMYWDRIRGARTFDVEHIFCEKFDPAKLPTAHGFADEKDYSISRNRIGALLLLPRSRNRSLQAKPYSEKLGAYATENVLAQTLVDGFYISNPKVRKFVDEHPGFSLRAITEFSKSDIDLRAATYTSIASKIWGYGV